MVNFSRTKKHAKWDLNMNPRESLVPDLWSPGSRMGVRYGDMFRISLNLYNCCDRAGPLTCKLTSD